LVKSNPKLGHISQFKVDTDQNKYLIVAFTSGEIQIFENNNGFRFIKSLGTYQFVKNVPFFIDDNCTYLAYLDQSQKQIRYLVINWDYKFSKVEPIMVSMANKLK
jgi:hypothetical protein